MKAVILAGGLGTRLSEETTLRPKPMVEVGGRPILWHILKMYAHHGINDFVICCGYKGNVIKEFFANRKLSTRSNESLPLHLFCVTLLKQEHLHCSTSATFQFQTRWQYSCVINHHNITWLQIVNNVTHLSMRNPIR
jgi:NDP-sugar pyrophosphorylase family protein